MPRAPAKTSDIDACGLSLGELGELWLGPNPSQGSLFRDREELVAAWEAGRAVCMRLWGSHGRRPQGFYEFEWKGPRPPYDVERSTLWRAGVLSEAERAELEVEWAQAYDAAKGKGARERREAYENADIPEELIRAWAGARRRPAAVPEQEEAAAAK